MSGEERNMTSPTNTEQQEGHPSDAPQVSPESGTSDFKNETTKKPSPNDVLCGRGGSINSHPGNERFRTLVEKRKRVYLTARFKREKRLIASSIVSEIRSLDPPGRFLQQDKKTGLWKDIGDEKARDKTSQALRENAPTIRAEIETEINEQRAELRKEEEEAQAKAAAHMPPQPSPSYYQGAWGPSYPSYYGYSHHAPPPPPHHHPHAHPGYYPPPPEGQWGYYPPPPHGHPHPPHAAPPPPPQPSKSAFEQTADYISSGAESIKRWTEDNLSFSGTASTGGGSLPSRTMSHDAGEAHVASGGSLGGGSLGGGSVGSMGSRPLSYVHHDDSKKRRMVKFRSDTKRHARRRVGSVARMQHHPSTHSVASGNSLLDNQVQDMEPQDLAEETNSTLMDQVATQILGSIGSWDAGSVFCGNDTTEKPAPAFPAVSGHPHEESQCELPQEQEEDMAVEWEGQEVQLIDQSGNDHDESVASEERMPPPARMTVHDQQSSVGFGSTAFSSLGSCHSWLPMQEQFNATASYFSGRGEEGPGSMDLEASAGGLENHSQISGLVTGDQSANGSIGGGSLTRVFENEAMPDAPPGSMPGSPDMGHRVLAHMPSWERSLRSRSPLSIESDGEDVSLISKESSKMSAENHFASSSQGQPQTNATE